MRGVVREFLIAAVLLAGCGDSAVKYAQGLKQDTEIARAAEKKANAAITGVAIRTYQSTHGGANPPTLQALVDEGLINKVPAELEYDPATGQVK